MPRKRKKLEIEFNNPGYDQDSTSPNNERQTEQELPAEEKSFSRPMGPRNRIPGEPFSVVTGTYDGRPVKLLKQGKMWIMRFPEDQKATEEEKEVMRSFGFQYDNSLRQWYVTEKPDNAAMLREEVQQIALKIAGKDVGWAR